MNIFDEKYSCACLRDAMFRKPITTIDKILPEKNRSYAEKVGVHLLKRPIYFPIFILSREITTQYKNSHRYKGTL